MVHRYCVLETCFRDIWGPKYRSDLCLLQMQQPGVTAPSTWNEQLNSCLFRLHHLFSLKKGLECNIKSWDDVE